MDTQRFDNMKQFFDHDPNFPISLISSFETRDKSYKFDLESESLGTHTSFKPRFDIKSEVMNTARSVEGTFCDDFVKF